MDACVHCGFCLQACPTFLATGDEADGPRGRIELMRSLERGTLAATDPTLTLHLDRCLGCRGCETVCPSGVRYGWALETARAVMVEGGDAGRHRLTAWLLALLTAPLLSPAFYAAARWLRAAGLARSLGGGSRLGFALRMLEATRPQKRGAWGVVPSGAKRSPESHHIVPLPTPPSSAAPIVRLFRGCVMSGLFGHVHAATIRILTANGYAVVETPGQVCCGALHAHAGLEAEARALARANLAAFRETTGPVVVNSAGCGAMLKEYGLLLPGDAGAAAFTARVRDVSELLVEAGPRPGAPVPLTVAYDPPCHLLHAQRVADAPPRVLQAIPEVRLAPLEDADQCCGGAGVFTLTQPRMARAVLAAKVDRIARAKPDVVATGNPGCQMQIGAGLRAAGLDIVVCHPVELLDRSYAAAGMYARSQASTAPHTG